MNNRINNTNNINFHSINGVNKMDSEKTYEDKVYDMIDAVTERAEREVPEYGDFAPVYEEFKNTNSKLPIDRYQLKVLKMPKEDVPDEKQRFLQAAVYAPAGDYKADMLIGAGHKDKIMEILKSDEFPETLNDAYIKLVDFMQNPD